MSDERRDDEIMRYVQHRREQGDGLVVLEAHTAGTCPDRDNCWARDLHDQYWPRSAASDG